MLSNMEEVMTRYALSWQSPMRETGCGEGGGLCSLYSETNRFFYDPLPLYRFSYLDIMVAAGRGCDVDKPRNLAKSVTVE